MDKKKENGAPVNYMQYLQVKIDSYIFTGCFLRPDIKRFCLIFTIGPDMIWFCLILVSDFFYNKSKNLVDDLI